MADKHEYDPHDPRGGRTNPTGPQGSAEQEKWQKGKFGETAVRDASTKLAEDNQGRGDDK